jgi:hypothetical protein
MRLVKDRVEHRCEIAGRGIDDAEHLSQGGFASEPFVALCPTLGKLSLRSPKLALKIGYALLRTS